MTTSLEATLADLVAIPSATHSPTACRESIIYVQKRLAAHGLHIVSELDCSHPWMMATTKNTKEPDILLAAHLDVVPGAPEVFELRRQGDKLVGRGTYDMKFAVACYLEFIDRHANDLHDLNLGLLFTTDEEVGGDSVVEIVRSGVRPKIVFLPDGGDDWFIEQRAKGFFGIKLEAHGKTAHGSRPWEGDNAINRILDVCAALRSEFPMTSHEGMTLSINGISGGHAVNQVPDHATAILDVRSFDAEQLAHFDRRIHEIATASRVDVLFTQTANPVNFDKSNPAVQKFLSAYQTVLGTAPKYKDSFGGTDARHFMPYHIPCILLEPQGGGRHAPDEWLERSSLETYYQLIETWLMSERANVTAVNAIIADRAV